MNDSEFATLSARHVQLQRLREGILPVFPLLKTNFEHDLSRLTASLIHANDDVTRGRIQQLLELLRMPEKLDEEIQNLDRILKQPDEATTQQGLDGLTGLFRMQ